MYIEIVAEMNGLIGDAARVEIKGRLNFVQSNKSFDPKRQSSSLVS